MNKGYIQDHASREWCINPQSQSWRDAFIKEWHAINQCAPRVAISSACARVSARFQRTYKEGQ